MQSKKFLPVFKVKFALVCSVDAVRGLHNFNIINILFVVLMFTDNWVNSSFVYLWVTIIRQTRSQSIGCAVETMWTLNFRLKLKMFCLHSLKWLDWESNLNFKYRSLKFLELLKTFKALKNFENSEKFKSS